MMVHKIKLPGNILLFLSVVIAAVSAATCGYLAVTEPTLPPLARVGLGTGVLFGLAWTVWLLKVLRSGQLNLATDSRRAAQMSWLFTVLMVTFFLVLGMSTPDRQKGILMILQALAFLIGAAVYWLNYRIEAAECHMREQILRMEMHLTELLEKQAR